MLKHSAIVAAAAGLENYFCNISARATTQANQETYLAYLPAAHILEFAAEMSMLTHGAKVGKKMNLQHFFLFFTFFF